MWISLLGAGEMFSEFLAEATPHFPTNYTEHDHVYEKTAIISGKRERERNQHPKNIKCHVDVCLDQQTEKQNLSLMKLALLSSSKNKQSEKLRDLN